MDQLRAYPLSIIATPNARNTMMTGGYRTSDASNRRKLMDEARDSATCRDGSAVAR